MPITVSCDCGKQFRARDEDAGKRGRCPGCGRSVTIPGGAGGSSPPPPGLPIRKSLAHPGAARGGAGFHVQPLHLVLLGAVVCIVAVVLLIQLGPAKAAKEWARISETGRYDITDVVVRSLTAERARTGTLSRMAGPLPAVKEIAFFESDVYWHVPEAVGFNGVSTEGPFKGKYHTRSGEVELTLDHWAGPMKITGRRKGGDLEAEINGKKVVSAAPAAAGQ